MQWLSRLTRYQETWVRVPVGAFNQFLSEEYVERGKKEKRCPYTYMYVPFYCHICVSLLASFIVLNQERNLSFVSRGAIYAGVSIATTFEVQKASCHFLIKSDVISMFQGQ